MEETVSSKLLHEGRNFSFKTDVVRLSNGKETVRDIVDHPGAVGVIAVDDGEIVLIKQYRYSVRSEILEIPAGTLEKDEDPYACAVRELREETGYAAKEWSELMSAYVAPGYTNEILHFYVAEGLTHVGADTEEDETINVEKYSFNEVSQLIESNQIRDAKTIAGILAYLTKTNA